MLIRTIAGLLMLAALAGCGSSSEADLPTVFATPSGNISAPSVTSSAPASAAASTDPVVFAESLQTAAITQSVTSDLGFRYDIPVDWEVSEGPDQSNFRTPALMTASFTMVDFSVRGYVAQTSIEKIYGQTGVSEADAIPRLFESEGAPDYNLQQPTEIMLPDGRQAQFAAYDSTGEMTALYFITLGADDYLKVVLIVRDPQNLVDDTLADYRDLFDRIAASAQPAS